MFRLKPKNFEADSTNINTHTTKRNEKGSGRLVELLLVLGLVGVAAAGAGLIPEDTPEAGDQDILVAADYSACGSIGSTILATSGGENDGTDPRAIVLRSFLGQAAGAPVTPISSSQIDSNNPTDAANLLIETMVHDEIAQNVCVSEQDPATVGRIVFNQQGTLLIQLETGKDTSPYLVWAGHPGAPFSDTITLQPIPVPTTLPAIEPITLPNTTLPPVPTTLVPGIL